MRVCFEMRQRTGRRKFHDLRLLTFQDWVVPHYNKPQRKVNEIMKNGRLPVFSYTKMDNGPPLSPISSQFAWAGHTLPDLVQEQSERLLRRLERPSTADNKISHCKNNRMKGGKVPRPLTALPLKIRTPSATRFHVNGTKCDSSIAGVNETSPSETTQNLLKPPTYPESHHTPSPVSERSSSPDFIASMYKEYEKKLSSDLDDEALSPATDVPSPVSPVVKLLRRPNIQLHTKQSARRSANCTQTKAESIVQCVIKLPCDQSNFSEYSNGGNCHPKHKPPKSETWLDLSELCQLSDEEMPSNRSTDVTRFHRPSIVSDSGSSLKILDLLSECGETPQGSETKKLKSKIARPCSSNSKNPRRSRPKSRSKRRRPNSAVLIEESGKQPNQALLKSSEVGLRRVKTSDKLREEIETQMSKLDFDHSAEGKLGSTTRNLPPVRRTPLATNTCVPPVKKITWKPTPTQGSNVPNFKSSLPLKKVPIQILSDPFSSKVKLYGNEK